MNELPKPGTLGRLGDGGYVTCKGHVIRYKHIEAHWYIYDSKGRVYDKAKQMQDLRRRYA